MRSAISLILCCAGLAACAEPPFVDHYVRVKNTNMMETKQEYVQKHKPQIAEFGYARVCFSDSHSRQEVLQVAQDTCDDYGLQAVIDSLERYQCRFSAPHQAKFRCVDPAMKTPDGQYVNVFDPKAVLAWEEQTGQKAPLRQIAGAYMAWPERNQPASSLQPPVPLPAGQ